MSSFEIPQTTSDDTVAAEEPMECASAAGQMVGKTEEVVEMPSSSTTASGYRVLSKRTFRMKGYWQAHQWYAGLTAC